MFKKKLCSNINGLSFDENICQQSNKHETKILKRSNSIESYVDKDFRRFAYNKKIGKMIQSGKD